MPLSLGGGGGGRRIGSKSVKDELSKYFGCSGVIPGRPEVQHPGKGPSSILAGRTAEYSMLGGPPTFSFHHGQSPGSGQCQFGWPRR